MRRLRRWMHYTVRLAAIGAAAACLVFLDYPQASAELPEALNEYRAEGLPWLASEIVPPPVPESENAAGPLRKAIAALPEKSIGYQPSGNAPYGTIPFIVPFERALALAYDAAKRPRLDFRRDWDLGSWVQFPEEAGVKSLVRTFTARAELRSRKGDDEGALADLTTARRLARLVAQDRGIIPTLVAGSCDIMASAQARHCLAKAADDPIRLRRYRSWLGQPAPLLDLHRAFRDEIFQTVATARNLDRMGIGTSWNPGHDLVGEVSDCSDCEKLGELTSANVRRDGLPTLLRSRAYLARCLQMWTELSRGTHGLKDSFEEIALQGDYIQNEYLWPWTATHLHDNVLFPVFAQFGRLNRKLLASRVLSLAYADALLLHATTGRWPSHCTVPDPLGDGYLRVRNDKGRFRIWSVGNNGYDDNGLTGTESREGQYRDDLVAAYPPFAPYIPRPARALARYTNPD